MPAGAGRTLRSWLHGGIHEGVDLWKISAVFKLAYGDDGCSFLSDLVFLLRRSAHTSESPGDSTAQRPCGSSNCCSCVYIVLLSWWHMSVAYVRSAPVVLYTRSSRNVAVAATACCGKNVADLRSQTGVIAASSISDQHTNAWLLATRLMDAEISKISNSVRLLFVG